MKYILSVFVTISCLCHASCSNSVSGGGSERFCYVEMENLGFGNVVGIEGSCGYLINRKGGHAYSMIQVKKGVRYGVVDLDIYANDIVPSSDVHSIEKMMDQALDSRLVDKWVVIRSRSYGKDLVGVYQEGDVLDFTKKDSKPMNLFKGNHDLKMTPSPGGGKPNELGL